MPCGLAFSSPSGISGRPVESEKRTVTGMVLPWNSTALLSAEASWVGAKVPSTMTPLAWLARIPACWPHSLFITSTICSATDASSAKAAGPKTQERATAAAIVAVRLSLIKRTGDA